jgi:hypothetical protein
MVKPDIITDQHGSGTDGRDPEAPISDGRDLLTVLLDSYSASGEGFSIAAAIKKTRDASKQPNDGEEAPMTEVAS